MNTTQPTVFFLTAIPLEYQAVLAHLDMPRETLWNDTKTKYYAQGEYCTPRQVRCRVIVRQLERMGNLPALGETKDAISRFHPQYLFFVGIAAKLKDVDLGDVVASSQVESYEVGKMQGDDWQLRATITEASKRLLAVARHLVHDEHWQDKIKPLPAPRKPKAVVGSIVSGEKVVDSSKFIQQIRHHHSNAVALEMEGLGFLEAIRDEPTAEGIVIRGISDAGERKAETDKEDWQPVAASHAAAFAFAMLDELLVPALPVPPCPYPGLQAFQPEDAKNFYGREDEARQLLKKVLATPLVAVIGASGTGKSSLVFAGLIPQLSPAEWLVLDFRVQLDLTTPEPQTWVLYSPRPSAWPAVTQRFRETGQPLAEVVESIFAEFNYQKSLLLVLDQFEELYTVTTDKALQQRFLDWLLAGVESLQQYRRVKLRVVLTLRVDFMQAGLAYPPLATALNQGNEMLGPIASAALLRQVIEAPAQNLGVTLAAGLTDRILQDLQQQQEVPLPLLQFALEKLWERQQDQQLTHAAYEAVGELQGALSKYAEAQYQALPAGQEKALQHIFTQLVHPATNSKRVATVEQIGAAQWALVGELVKARLVITRRDESSHLETVELVHEVLITGWGRLGHWVDANREFRSWQDRVEEDMNRWEAAQRDKGALLRGVRLGEAEEKLKQYGEAVTGRERAFIEASVREKQWQLRIKRAVTFGLVILLIVSVVTAILGLRLWRIAEQQSEMAQLRYDGVLNERGARYQEALDSYLKALNISRNLRDDKAQAFNLSDVGTMYMNLGKFELALDYFKQARKIREQLGDSQGVKFEIGNITLVLGNLGQPEKAVDFYEQEIGVKEKGHGKFVGYITSLNCPNSAFELFRGTQKLPLVIAIPLYPGDKLKVTEEKCEMRVSLEKKGNIRVNLANSPYVVPEISSSPPILQLFSDITLYWLKSLGAQQQEYRMTAGR